MDVEDTRGFALEVIGRSDEEAAVDPRQQQQETDTEQPVGGRARDLQEARGIGETVHGTSHIAKAGALFECRAQARACGERTQRDEDEAGGGEQLQCAA